MDNRSTRLVLTEDEAFALLSLAMTSGIALDATSEKAVKKLADYCRVQGSIINTSNHSVPAGCEYSEAG